jgi:hypothetical protein
MRILTELFVMNLLSYTKLVYDFGPKDQDLNLNLLKTLLMNLMAELLLTIYIYTNKDFNVNCAASRTVPSH